MHTAFFGLKKWEEDYVKRQLEGFSLAFYGNGEMSSVNPNTEIISIFVDFPADKLAIGGLPNLKFIATRSTGFDHIDLKYCEEKSILVSNVPTYGENTVAEFTFALLLSLSRKLYPAIKRVREEALFSVEGLQGFDLKGKIMGVVGTGHIGAYVVKIARGFGMEVAAYDPYPNQKLAAEYGFKYLSLEDLLKISDVITLHVPYMPATHHLLNKENLTLCKKGAVLVNTARGGLVETQGLVSALRQGILAGAAIDVLEEEGFVKEEAEILANSHPNEQQLKTALAAHAH